MKLEIRKCLRCGNTFPVGSGRKFCSEKCTNSHSKRPAFYLVHTFACLSCGQSFRSLRPIAKWCSDKCSQKQRRAAGKNYQAMYGKTPEAKKTRSERRKKLRASLDWRSRQSLKERQHSQNRRARERKADGWFRAEDFRDKCADMGWRCHWCGCALTPLTVTVDHVKPLAKGGSNWIVNLVPACRPCNTKKGDRTPRVVQRTLIGKTP